MMKRFLHTLVAVMFATVAVAQTYPSPTVNNITVQGDLNLPSKPANSVMVSPDGSAGAPTFRTLAPGDIPSLDAAKVTTGEFNAARIPTLDAAKIASGVFAVGLIPNLDAAKITTGVFNAARIPSLDAAIIATGAFDPARIPALDTSKLTTGVLPVARGGTGAATAAANLFFATPDGSSGAPSFRSMVAADVPSLAISKVTGLQAALDLKAALASPAFTGVPTAPTATVGTNTTQIATTAFVLANNATPTFPTQTANTVFAGPASGGAALPAFRAMVADDIPAHDAAKITTGTLPVARGGTGTTTSTGSGSVVLNTSPSFSTDLTVNGAAATNRNIRFTTANALRWQLIGNNNAEAGSNAGTNFSIGRYDDAGAFLSLPFWIERATGEVGINNTNPGYNLDVGGTFRASGDAVIGGNLTANNTTINFTTPSAANTNFNGAGVEMFWTGGPYIDFKNDAATDFDVRMQLIDDDTIEFQGNTVVNGNTTVIANIINDALPNLSKSVQGTGVPGLDGAHWMLWNSQTGSTFDPVPTLRIDRNASPSVVAGTPANTYQAVKINGTAGVNNQGYEWPLTVEMHNYSLSSLNSENVAINGTAWLENNGVGETGKTWGANFNVSDKTTTVNPTKGRVALELDTYADPAGSTDNNRARVGLQIAVGTHNGVAPSAGTPLHIGRGFLVGANQANVIMDRLMEVGGLGTYDIGIDTTAATFAKPVMFMKEAQRVAFDGNTSGSYNRSLRYSTGQFIYASQNGDIHQISDAGAITAGSTASGGIRLSLANSAGTCTLTPTATTAAFACSSDERLKENITDAGSAVEWLRGFRVREYDIKATGDHAAGVIAQEVQETHPDMVKTQEDGMLAVEAPNAWMLVKAVQEQQDQINLLRNWLIILSASVVVLAFLSMRRRRV